MEIVAMFHGKDNNALQPNRPRFLIVYYSWSSSINIKGGLLLPGATGRNTLGGGSPPLRHCAARS
jgi:hypothetical protein